MFARCKLLHLCYSFSRRYRIGILDFARRPATSSGEPKVEKEKERKARERGAESAEDPSSSVGLRRGKLEE